MTAPCDKGSSGGPLMMIISIVTSFSADNGDIGFTGGFWGGPCLLHFIFLSQSMARGSTAILISQVSRKYQDLSSIPKTNILGLQRQADPWWPLQASRDYLAKSRQVRDPVWKIENEDDTRKWKLRLFSDLHIHMHAHVGTPLHTLIDIHAHTQSTCNDLAVKKDHMCSLNMLQTAWRL